LAGARVNALVRFQLAAVRMPTPVDSMRAPSEEQTRSHPIARPSGFPQSPVTGGMTRLFSIG